MRVAVFCHSIISDWNNDSADFLRGVVTELLARRHDVRVYEPRNAWCAEALAKEHGERALERFRIAYPRIRPKRYDREVFDLDAALDEIDLVLVTDGNDAQLVKRIAERRQRAGARFKALFHDTHRPEPTGNGPAPTDVSGYDAVLAAGSAIRAVHERNASGPRVIVWHEAADPRVYFPVAPPRGKEADAVWIGECRDDERAAELRELFADPVKELGIVARAYGPRLPVTVADDLAQRSIGVEGWIPSFAIPEVFARFRCAVHLPSRARSRALPGVPDIRMFQALACAIPLVSAPWQDDDGLFVAGRDYLLANDAGDMRRHLKLLVGDAAARSELARHGRSTILARHTCAHRVDELLSIAGDLGVRVRKPALAHETAHV